MWVQEMIVEHPRHAAIHNQSPLTVSQHGYSAANSDKGYPIWYDVAASTLGTYCGTTRRMHRLSRNAAGDVVLVEGCS